jgi:hypothetical protein
MRVHVESVLDCPPDRVWDEVQKSALLLEVIRPLVRIVPVGAHAFPERWSEGPPISCQSYLFGVLPLGTRTLLFERIDHATRTIQTRECDPLSRRWDHLIAVRPTADGRTRYADTIDLDAGLLTPLVWLFAWCFYHHRQRRWRRVARRLAAG